MGRRSVALMLGICSLTGGLFACLFEIMLRLKKTTTNIIHYHTKGVSTLPCFILMPKMFKFHCWYFQRKESCFKLKLNQILNYFSISFSIFCHPVKPERCAIQWQWDFCCTMYTSKHVKQNKVQAVLTRVLYI